MNADAQPLFVPVILAGGGRERFRPLACQHRPKPCPALDGSRRNLGQATAAQPEVHEPEGLAGMRASASAAARREAHAQTGADLTFRPGWECRA